MCCICICGGGGMESNHKWWKQDLDWITAVQNSNMFGPWKDSTICLQEFLPDPDMLTTVISDFSLKEPCWVVFVSSSITFHPAERNVDQWRARGVESQLVPADWHPSQCDSGDTREEHHWLSVWSFTSWLDLPHSSSQIYSEIPLVCLSALNSRQIQSPSLCSAPLVGFKQMFRKQFSDSIGLHRNQKEVCVPITNVSETQQTETHNQQ